MPEKQKQAVAQEPTKLYRITHGKYHRMEGGEMKVYRANSKVNLTRDEALSLRTQIERAHPTVDEELEAPPATVSASTSIAALDYLSDLSEQDAIVVINGLGTAEEVTAAIEAEHRGKNRPAVIKAAQDRIA